MRPSGVVFFILAFLTWLFLIADLATVVGADGRGDRDIFLGLRWILAGVLVFALWIWLGGILVSAAAQGLLPAWVRTAAWILCPASAAAAFAALYLVNEANVRWALAVPVGAPVLILVYVAVLYRSALTAPAIHICLWSLVAALTISVWPFLAVRVNGNAQAALAAKRLNDEQDAREKEHRRAESLARLRTMSPEAHLVEWYSLLEPENGVRDEALAALRNVARRQGDVEEGLGYGIPRIMTLVPDLDLEPTPALCNAARAWLGKAAQDLRAGDRERRPYDAKQLNIDRALPGLRWFEDHGCDCAPGIAALENVLRADFIDSPDLQKLFALLDALKDKR